MKNVKEIILALITLIGTLAIGVLAVNRMLVMEKGSESVLRTSIEEDYDENIKNQVDNAISMLDAVYAGYENGDYSYEEAETRGADLLRELRYGDGGYFWADTTEHLSSEARPRNKPWRQRMGRLMVKEINVGSRTAVISIILKRSYRGHLSRLERRQLYRLY